MAHSYITLDSKTGLRSTSIPTQVSKLGSNDSHARPQPCRDTLEPVWRHPIMRSAADGFCIEIVSISCSVALTIALGAVLFVYDDQSLPSWPLGITLNAVVSLLVTAIKSMLLLVVAECISQYKWLNFSSTKFRPLIDLHIFDSASRGPWGAMNLLMTRRPKTLVTLGCLVTVLCLALDPFGQQVLLYRTRPVQVARATVASTTTYGEASDDTFASVESPMLQAIYNGVLDEGIIQPVGPMCTTGNCTFDDFETLGFCSECCDTSSDVQKDCLNNEDTINCTYRFPGGTSLYFNNETPLKLMEAFTIPLNTTFPSNLTTCRIEASGNAAASFGFIEVEPNVDVALKQAKFCLASSTMISTWRSFNDNPFVGDPTTNSGQIDIGTDYSERVGNSSRILNARSDPTTLPAIIQPAGGTPEIPKNSNTTLISIGFNDRVQYPTVANDSSLVASLLNNVTSLLSEPLGLSSEDVVVLYLKPINTLSTFGYITTRAVINFPTNAISRLRRLLLLQSSQSTTASYSDPATQSLLSALEYSYSTVPISTNGEITPSNYLISQKRFFALNAWFADAFTGTVSQSFDLFRGVYRVDQIAASSDLMSVIYNHGDINRTMQNLATSMSNYVRSSSSSDAVEGKALGTETYVQVRWAWLSLLVLCVLCTFCLLACTVFNTKTNGSGIAWKSSTLATFFQGIEQAESDRSAYLMQGRMKHVSEMERVARSTKVRLVDDGIEMARLRPQMREESYVAPNEL